MATKIMMNVTITVLRFKNFIYKLFKKIF